MGLGRRGWADGRGAREGRGGAHLGAPPSEEVAFQRKHMLPGSVCSNSLLGTCLVHRAKSPERQFVQLEPRRGGRAGQGGRGGLGSPQGKAARGGDRTGPLSRRGVSPRCSSVPGVRFSQRFTTARAESSCTATSLKRKKKQQRLNKLKKKKVTPLLLRFE